MNKIKIELSAHACTCLQLLIQQAIFNFMNKQDRVRGLVIAVLFEVYLKLEALKFKLKKINKINISLSQAQAIVVAYEKGWLKARPNDAFAENVLLQAYSYLHQKTA
jgi:hypothetical protein